MEIEKPWKTLPGSYLRLDASVKAFDRSGKLIRKQPFQFIGKKVQRADIAVTAEKVKRLDICASLKYRVHHPGKFKMVDTSSGAVDVTQSWLLEYGSIGVEFFRQEPKKPVPSTDGIFGLLVYLSANQSPREKPIGFLSLGMILLGGYEIPGISVSWKAISVGIGEGSESGKEEVDFAMNVFDGTSRKKDVAIPLDLLRLPVYFEEDYRYLDRKGLNDIREWHNSLAAKEPRLYASIKEGRVPIYLYGHASTTGTDAYNYKISRDRIHDVRAEVNKSFRGGLPNFIEMPFGKAAATRKGRVPGEKRVEIVIEEADAWVVLATAKRSR